jgi:hypothetical protein
MSMEIFILAFIAFAVIGLIAMLFRNQNSSLVRGAEQGSSGSRAPQSSRDVYSRSKMGGKARRNRLPDEAIAKANALALARLPSPPWTRDIITLSPKAYISDNRRTKPISSEMLAIYDAQTSTIDQ